MLQKVIVVVVGLVMSVLGALTPDALFASNDGAVDALSADTTEETLSTVRVSDGQAFARISVLWVEVDGRRVTEDAWGTGELEEMRFKVGVKGVDDAAIAVGDNLVELHPTDIITVRMFRGDFSYRGVGTALATIQLQGTVKTTVLKEGDIVNRLQTAPGELDLGGKLAARNGGDERVAYVVLTTGEKVDTVAVEDGGARLFTNEGATAAEATTEAGNLLAKWVKMDGKLLREYTWGDGVVKRIEFEPAEAATRSVVLTYNDEVAEVAAGERVVIDDFVGEYLVYQVSGGMMRLRLDGYSASFATGTRLTLPGLDGTGAPLADFNWTPVSPKTTDSTRFTADIQDEDGIPVFIKWDFGDDTSIVGQERPTHRFERPGVYEVTLSVTDNELQTTNVSHTIVVRNAEPVPDFDFSPKVVTTQTMVGFSDMSFDNDGSIESYEWDFGDGNTSSFRSPSHKFAAGGNYTVTLSTTDDLGSRQSLSKVLLVRNAPPSAAFRFTTPDNRTPLTLDPIQFYDLSSDTDGTVVSWNWSFGDGNFGSGSAPNHQFRTPGLYTVTLTAFDDKDDADTVSTNILVGNRPPFADFEWSPNASAPAGTPISFRSTSDDPDGVILLHVWEFGDGGVEVRGASASHTFPRVGSYNVTLRVTDNTLGTSSVTKTVHVANSAPRANFQVSQSPAFRNTQISFTDLSTDPDGDAIVAWTWDFGDNSSSSDRFAEHSYTTMGTKMVTLTVTDAEGLQSSVSRPLRILNRPPSILAEYGPLAPEVGQTVTFSAEGDDPDVSGGLLTFDWQFSDGVQAQGDTVTRTFSASRAYSANVRARDADGGVSAPRVLTFFVDHARPVVDFSFTPNVPVKGVPVAFNGTATPAPDATLVGFRWLFDSGGAQSTLEDPSFTYPTNGSFNVTFQAIDDFGMVGEITKEIYVNLPPVASFSVTPGVLQLNVPFQLNDESTDLDGEIVAWRWDFGDGSPIETTQTPAPHTYTSSGAYPATLTVTDDVGTSTTHAFPLEVANAPPVAAFGHSAAPEERNALYSFDASASSDPDGPITRYMWNFGDGTGNVNTTAPTIDHVYTRSANHVVKLTVFDQGNKSASREQTIRVGASHPVEVNVRGQFPDGRPIDLSAPGFTVTARINGALALPPSNVQQNGTAYRVDVPQNLWLDGYRVDVTIASPHLKLPFQKTGFAHLRDDQPFIDLPITLELRMIATIDPDWGENATIFGLAIDEVPALDGANETPDGDPIVQEPLEEARGTGTLRYANLEPASNQPVRIFARYVPLKAVSAVRDAPQITDTTNGGILGWCPVAEAVTDVDGTFDWRFDASQPCVTNGLGMYPVGRWEVRAAPAADAESVSQARAVYYDPTGGFLLIATLGQA